MRRIGGIILAAGGSRRLGQPKQLLEFHGETLVHASVRAAQEGGCDRVCVVTGHAREAAEKSVADLCPLLVHNEDWRRGMGSSIRLGGAAIQPVSAVVLLACDQPAVDAAVVRSLIEMHHRTGAAIVASHYSGTLGIPALFDDSHFSSLQNLPDDRGAKAVIEANLAAVTSLEFPAGSLDVDSPEDLRAWRTLSSKNATVGAGSREKEKP
jgi:molybdenum cofactor cytidylyltransferase